MTIRGLLSAENLQYLCGRFGAWVGNFMLEKHKSPPFFLFLTYQRTNPDFPEKCVPFLSMRSLFSGTCFQPSKIKNLFVRLGLFRFT